MPLPPKSNRTRQSTSNHSRAFKEQERALLEKWMAENRLKPRVQGPVKQQEHAPADTSVSDEHRRLIEQAYLTELATAPKKKHEDDEFED